MVKDQRVPAGRLGRDAEDNMNYRIAIAIEFRGKAIVVKRDEETVLGNRRLVGNGRGD